MIPLADRLKKVSFRTVTMLTASVVTVDVTDDLDTAYQTFRRTGVRRLPVVDGRRLVGLLAVDDLLLDVLHCLFDLLGPISWSALREGGPNQPTRTVRSLP